MIIENTCNIKIIDNRYYIVDAFKIHSIKMKRLKKDLDKYFSSKLSLWRYYLFG